MIYLITVNYYSTQLIEKLILSLGESKDIAYKIIIVNNSPEESCIDEIKSENVIILNARENLGFGRACNLGLNWVYDRDRQSIVWIINPDAYLLENSLASAEQLLASHPEISILGTAVCEPNGQVWFGGGKFMPQNGTIVATQELLSEGSLPYRTVDWVTGCSLLLNLNRFGECPQFDPDYFLYYEDFDFCQRYARSGHIIGMSSRIRVIHQPSSITNRHLDLKQQHTIYSYLLALEKHASRSVLLSRLAKMIISALISLPFNYKVAVNKLQGVLIYCKRVLRLWAIHF